jgi:outer membrane protein TolC
MSHPLPGQTPLLSTKLLTCSLLVLALTGCSSLTPTPLTNDEIRAVSAADNERMRLQNETLQGPLTLEEAIARALRYNLERRARSMEEAVARGLFDVGQFDMLPRVVASAGYQQRDKFLISRSTDSVTGAPSLANPYISTDKSASTHDLAFTWSLLDFGQSYYASKQNADRVLIAAERKRKAQHTLIQDVTTAFWRAASAQKLKNEVEETIRVAEEALVDSRQAESERLRNPLDALRYQRQLLENLRLLEAVNQELSTARIELAALANIPFTVKLEIVEPTDAPNTKWLELPVERMEEVAILQNADLRESIYNARIAREETRRAMLKLFPGLSFTYASKSSNDSYLINQHWNESGIQLSFNLLGILSAPAQMRLADAGVAVADQRRMTTQMAVLTQLHIARLQYGNAYRQYERADAIAKADSAIAEQMTMREQVQLQTKLDRVANQTSSILSQLRRYQALAQVHAAASKLQATLGLEPAAQDDPQAPLTTLTQSVAQSLQRWSSGELPTVKPAAQEK